MLKDFKTKLAKKTVELTTSKHAERNLWALSFAESSFFPLPPDLMLGPMAANTPNRWMRLALGCTIASVLGGILGYVIGYYFIDTAGKFIIEFFHLQDKLVAFHDQYEKYGVWVILIKGLTPIPYKLVTIASGIAHFSLPIFIAASLVTRGARFVLVAWLFAKYGAQMGPVIEKRMGLVMLGVAAVLIAGIVLLQFLH